jgi:hypothetical protein
MQKNGFRHASCGGNGEAPFPPGVIGGITFYKGDTEGGFIKDRPQRINPLSRKLNEGPQERPALGVKLWSGEKIRFCREARLVCFFLR